MNIKTKPATFKELPISLRPNLLGRRRPPRSALSGAASLASAASLRVLMLPFRSRRPRLPEAPSRLSGHEASSAFCARGAFSEIAISPFPELPLPGESLRHIFQTSSKIDPFCFSTLFVPCARFYDSVYTIFRPYICICLMCSPKPNSWKLEGTVYI